MSGLQGGALSMPRRALLDRIGRVDPAVLLLIAPAGFGKSALARQLLERGDAVCEASSLGDGQPLPASDGTILVENADAIAGDPARSERFMRALESRASGSRLVICSRKPLPAAVTRLTQPHETLTLRARDLAFDRREIAHLFQDAPCDPQALSRIAQLSQGWPIAVLLLRRLVAEGRIEALFDRAGEIVRQEFGTYVSECVLDDLEPDAAAVLFACACIPLATEDDLSAACPHVNAERVASHFARESPFLKRTDCTFSVHPMVASVLLEDRAQERDGLLLAVANAHADAREFLRAAELHVARRDRTAAADALAQHEIFSDGSPSTRYARILVRLDRDAVRRRPRLWAVTAMLRTGYADASELLEEAELLWQTMVPSQATVERSHVAALRALLLCDLGRVAEAWEFFSTYAAGLELGDQPETQHEAFLFLIRGALHARMGKAIHAEHDLTFALRWLGRVDVAAWLAHTSLASGVAAVRGDFPFALRLVERAIESARRSGANNLLAHALAEGAFVAWLSSEDAAFETYAAELSDLVSRSGVLELAGFAAATRRSGNVSPDAGGPKWSAYAHVLRAVFAGSTEAIDAARAYESPFLQVLAVIAAAFHDDARFDEYMREAIASARRVDSPALLRAVTAIARRETDIGMLQAFADRLNRERRPASTPLLEIRFVDGSVRCEGRDVMLPDGEHALLAALALRREGVSRSRLAAMLWPDLDEAAARNALGVCLHRLRSHLGKSDAIVRTKDGYALHEDVQVDLWDLEKYAVALKRDDAPAVDVRSLENLQIQLAAGTEGHAPEWEWYAPAERRISELRTEVARRLAEYELARGNARRALELADDMLAYDACDEGACRIAVAAYLALNDRGSALREYRRYRDRLFAELQCEPSEDLKRMVGISAMAT